MLNVHQRKYSSVNKLQDNFAFLALVMSLNPSASTGDRATLLVPNPGKLQPVIRKVAFFYKTCVSWVQRNAGGFVHPFMVHTPHKPLNL